MTLSADQLALRREGLTATDIAKIVTGHGIDVWLDKRQMSEPMPDNPRMKAGRMLQRAVASWAAEERGLVLGSEDVTRRSLVEPWALATPDFDCALATDVAGADMGVMEVKCVGGEYADDWGLPQTDEVPPRVRYQVEWQLFVAQRRWAVVSTLIGGNDMRTYDIQRDDDLQATLVELGREWWQRHIVRGEQPDLDGSESARRYVAEKWAKGKRRKSVRDATPAEADLVARLRAGKTLLAFVESNVAALEVAVADAIGLDSGIRTPDGVVSSSAVRGRVNYKAALDAIAPDFPEDKLVAFRGPTSIRVNTPRKWSKES